VYTAGGYYPGGGAYNPAGAGGGHPGAAGKLCIALLNQDNIIVAFIVVETCWFLICRFINLFCYNCQCIRVRLQV
jgi:hypothetical protein